MVAKVAKVAEVAQVAQVAWNFEVAQPTQGQK